MIAGHLQIKNDYYYMVLSYLDANGKRKQPWFPTGLPIKNNKKRAESALCSPCRAQVKLRAVCRYALCRLYGALAGGRSQFD